MLDASELATLALDLVAPLAGPHIKNVGKLGDESFDVQTPHNAS